MNDTMSVLLATTLLALGGLGLYMYKSEEPVKGKRSRKGKAKASSFFDGIEEDVDVLSDHSSDEDESDDEEDIKHEKDYEEEKEPPKRKYNNAKTQRSRKSSSSKRRY